MKKVVTKKKFLQKKSEDEKIISSLDLIVEYIMNILEHLKRKKTLEEILDIYEKNIDDYILEVCKKEKLNYISGYLTVNPTSEVVEIDIECYFQNKRKKWIKKEANNVISRENIADQIIECTETKYEIESPFVKMGDE